MKHAFSLVELSIVLVILGLLVGGILAGQSLIQAAELRGTIAEHGQVATAMRSYRDKYMAIAGDHNNAFAFWGTNCAATAAACDGDGNGYIDSWSDEYWTVWKHLELADMLKFKEVGNVGRHQSKLGDSTVYFLMKDGWYGTGTMLNKDALVLTHKNGVADSWLEGGTTPSQAWQIDTKLDDSLPTAGMVRARDGYDGATTITSTCISSNAYALTISSQNCWVALYL